jgi:hypothetical protein
MSTNESSLNIAHTDVTLARFEIHTGASGNLKFKVHITDVTPATVLSHDINQKALASSARSELRNGRFKNG